ncbi:Putative bifunctional phosphatase/peptidyl-prolyl cis-trans isomerase [Ephemeroptericola cinctiostellae]|uniref:Bifunctional phosphatase/peptidyl-prolyl cis-trans isomerase n=1 Tax=Ephemeroptericola cinctiostellae TaxID=2268024 RepID=A0A345DC35_9BURK|nr:Cof-type HAD-IIB family hydrolase [Ephemeroptericola cinctiostellae]AXF85923.1 Putative bifunctional phosphatase/peptidyl-prolyl cis-trans isomerase [Ephemeroptericola cinctiostellae]
MTKIFFFDIDNTLLDHQTNSIPESALSAINDLKANGHKVAIATGRSHAHAKTYLMQLQPSYAVMQNGAIILRGDEVMGKSPLAHDALMALFVEMTARGHSYGINGEAGGHVSAETEQVMLPMDSVAIKVNADFDFYKASEVLQGWLFFDESLDAELIPELHAMFPQFDYVRWHQTAVDVLPKGVNKLTGCQSVLKDLGMDAEQAYAFGDGLNDMEMLQGLGTGIAMGNAHPRLKEVADRVADSIQHDGLAKMVRQIQSELA